MKKNLVEKIINDKKNGIADKEIGEKYGVNLKFIEKAITKNTGVNVSNPSLKKKIKSLIPNNFKLENTTIWSFRSRGS